MASLGGFHANSRSVSFEEPFSRRGCFSSLLPHRLLAEVLRSHLIPSGRAKNKIRPVSQDLMQHVRERPESVAPRVQRPHTWVLTFRPCASQSGYPLARRYWPTYVVDFIDDSSATQVEFEKLQQLPASTTLVPSNSRTETEESLACVRL